MMKSNHFMLYDDMDCFYDIYVFEESENIDEVIKVVERIKKENVGEWTLETIEKAIKDNFKVKEVIYIDNVLKNYINVNEVGVNNGNQK